MKKSPQQIWGSLCWRWDYYKTGIYRKLKSEKTHSRKLRDRIKKRIRQLGKYYEDGNSDILGYTYHPIPFDEFDTIKAHRKCCEDRLQAILSEIDIEEGDWILDIGANVGYFSFALEKKGAFVESYEVNSDCFEIGAALSKLYDKNVLYINKPLSITTINFLRPYYKSILLLSVFHWILKQEGDEVSAYILSELAKRTDNIFFETPSNPHEAMFKHEYFASQQSVEAFLARVLPEARISLLSQDQNWGSRFLYRIDCTAIS